MNQNSSLQLLRRSRETREYRKKVDGVLKSKNLSAMQWVIINLVQANPRIRISDLSRELDSSMAFITTITHILEGRGFLKREFGEDTRARHLLYIGTPEFLDETEREIQERLAV